MNEDIDITFRKLDTECARRLVQADEAYCALEEVRQMLRHEWKHTEFETEEAGNLIEKLYERFHEICSDIDVL